MIPLDDAIKLVLDSARIIETENVDLHSAVGKILAQDVVADADQPPFSKSLVDGYAVGFDCESTNGMQQLAIIDRVDAGQSSSQTVGDKTAVQIMTGAPIPPGTSAVVMVEETKLLDANTVAIDADKVQHEQFILQQGAVCQSADVVATTGSRLTPARIGVLAEAGCARPLVYRDPSISIVTTGDEIVPVDSKTSDRCIRNSNGPLLVAAARQVTDNYRYIGHIADEMSVLVEALEAGLKSHVLVITGGVSMGQKDLIPEALNQLGVRQVFHKVNLKPGKPAWFGVFENDVHRCLVFGLPGNPVSTFVCFELLVKSALRKMRGQHNPGRFDESAAAILKTAFTNRGNRFLLQPGIYCGRSHEVEVLQWIGSADQIRLAAANCLIEFPASSSYSVGDQVVVRRI